MMLPNTQPELTPKQITTNEIDSVGLIVNNVKKTSESNSFIKSNIITKIYKNSSRKRWLVGIATDFYAS